MDKKEDHKGRFSDHEPPFSVREIVEKVVVNLTQLGRTKGPQYAQVDTL